MKSIPSPRFYFLEYFFVLLSAIDKQPGKDQAFSLFKSLKEKYRLGESKYKKLTQESKDFSPVRENRYHDTFAQVIEESKEIGLIEERKDGSLFVLDNGRRLLDSFGSEKVSQDFNLELFKLIERKQGVFRTLVEFLYSVQVKTPGLLVFPSYSPLQLGIERSRLKNGRDIQEYSRILLDRLQGDLKAHLDGSIDIKKYECGIIQNLQSDGLLDQKLDSPFDSKKYNAIIKRFRDYWITTFLKEVYHWEASWSTFERWVYRGKQIGITHATEFYPNFGGKIVYPTSVVSLSTANRDFTPIFNYSDGYKLFVHNPPWDDIQNQFVESLVDSYFDLRHIYRFRGRFISLHALREIVCFKMKISEYTFQDFLNRAYRLNLSGLLRIKISLEVDKLPEETKVRYLTREPVMVDGKFRNIISIEVTKEDKP